VERERKLWGEKGSGEESYDLVGRHRDRWRVIKNGGD